MKKVKLQPQTKFHRNYLRKHINEIVKPLFIIFNKLLTQQDPVKVEASQRHSHLKKKMVLSLILVIIDISLISVVGKLMESIIRDKTVEYLEKSDIIKDSQNGFRKNVHALLTYWISSTKYIKCLTTPE